MAVTDQNILLHICCAPCACYPVEELKSEGFKLRGYWYNPNIHGFREYSKRLMGLGYFIAKTREMNIIDSRYEVEEWFRKASSLPRERRCYSCYRMRIFKTAKKAVEVGINAFTTTLLYSKYQNHEMITDISKAAAKKNGVKFIYRDFRKGWKEGINKSKEMGLYRQQYCGCVFSEIERFNVSKKS